ncbi:50S ribosomal protein L29 [Candidatus Daviesbacteria bacterium RIFCSPHIGHO2_12_FULL_37_11]|uniref:Large ribosomal subunit protein uL29 n=1 Tax=Candidatus Daviesbacteria bacterium RIFCSPHIGHO2_12_FULL_37_11 TaxID=1797777 RepID=A0A1F5KCE9_9BACT|nr:MAG: 50S ribosomal protein L29 [Candidatus Daviesbacteria bacterium GWA1_38_6]OGE16463.1 MAG: 50S ribosomal protein L29 [Candidatus Daviesbacteria bacterium RIFCSPHIGHO2_01_FULL_37_27]OGE38558.1 MAG: 50S ribosomal protein L29 [Candidatus Daviesbacteria bacterium RIFCSPHIGHO2_12_FULL_37_11]OGE46269.1 MAG: 50S ribosomal protein L29 [Candidatus Daviesbacteria bacterium RIFCSPLOWO2_01_FULL_37_10]
MKKTDLKGIKNMEIKDLVKKIKESKVDMAGLFIAREQGVKGSKDIKGIYKKRKDIAQMMTILRQKELVEELSKESKI